MDNSPFPDFFTQTTRLTNQTEITQLTSICTDKINSSLDFDEDQHQSLLRTTFQLRTSLNTLTITPHDQTGDCLQVFIPAKICEW